MNPTSGIAGSGIEITFSGLKSMDPYGDNFVVTFNNKPISIDAKYDASGWGSIYLLITIPNDLSGTTLTVNDQTTGDTLSATFQVNPNTFGATDTNTQSTTSGYVGDALSFSFSGLMPDTYYNLYFGSALIGYAYADDSGSLSYVVDTNYYFTTLTVPSVLGGTYDIQLTTSAGIFIADQQFTVQPSIVLSQTKVVPGSIVTVNGYGFTLSDPTVLSNQLSGALGNVNVNLDNLQNTGDGSFTATFTVPTTMTGGVYSFAVTDNAGDQPQVVPFGVTVYTISDTTTSSSQIYVGDSVTFSVTGLTPNTNYELEFVDSQGNLYYMDFITSDNTGAWSGSYVIPQMCGGIETVQFADWNNWITIDASTHFTVLPSITFSPTNGPIGTQIEITVNGFLANDPSGDTIALTINGQSVNPDYGYWWWSGAGSITTDLTIPPGTTATCTITVTDTSSGYLEDTVTGTFQLTTPAITVSDTSNNGATSGYVGDTLTFSGSGLAPNTYYYLYFGGYASGTYIGYLHTDSSGSISYYYLWDNVPETVGGITYIAFVTWDESGQYIDVANVSFTLLESMVINPTSGPAGTEVTVEWNGLSSAFNPDTDTIVATINGQQISSDYIWSWGIGNLYAEFTVPSTAPGTYTFTATDQNTGDTAQTQFTVTTAQFSVLDTTTNSATSGYVGDTLTFSASGLAPNTYYNFCFDGLNGYWLSYGLTDGSGTLTQSWFYYGNYVPQVVGGSTNYIEVVDRDSENGVAIMTLPFTVLPSVSLSQTQGASGTTIIVTGNGFSSYDLLHAGLVATLNGQQITLNNLVTTVYGTFQATFTIPNLDAGTYSFAITDNLGDTPATIQFTINSPNNIQFSANDNGQTQGQTGDSVDFSASGLTSGNYYQINILDKYSQNNNDVYDFTADGSNPYTDSFQLPQMAGGSVIIQLTDDSGNVLAEVPFTILPSVSVTNTQTGSNNGLAQGYVGDTVTITGTGFQPDSTYTTYDFGGNTVTLTTDTSGNIIPCELPIVDCQGGQWYFEIDDNSGNYVTYAYFTVLPSITVSPTSGVAGTQVTVTGHGFNSWDPMYDNLVLYVNGDQISWSSISDSNDDNGGSFEMTFTIPSGTPIGTSTISVSDLSCQELGVSTGYTVPYPVVVTAPTQVTAGVPFQITVTIYDSSGNVMTCYTGTIHFTSTDQAAGLPADYTFTAADQGTHTFTVTLATTEYNINYETSGIQTITVTDTSNNLISGTSNGINVNPNIATQFYTFLFSNSVVAGQTFYVEVAALDAYGNLATGYTGTVHFTSTDWQAVLPSDSTLGYALINGQQIPFLPGAGIFQVTLDTSGSQTITVTDTADSSITGTSNPITVAPDDSSVHLVVSAPSTATAGTASTVTVTAEDAYGNTVTDYSGTVHFTSSDNQAVLPADFTLTNGVGTFQVTLETAGSQTITATDTATSSATATSSNIQVTHAATAFSIAITPSIPTSITAGSSQAFTATATDAYGNQWDATSQVQWTITSDAGGSWAQSTGTYTSANAGLWTVTANFGLALATTTLTVTHANIASLTITPSTTPLVAGKTDAISATAYDSYGNSWDVTSQTTWSITTGADGSWNNNVYTSVKAGTWTITGVVDSVKGTGTLTVNPSALDHFAVTFPQYEVMNGAFAVTVTAYDVYGNIVSFTGDITLVATQGSINSFNCPIDAGFLDRIRGGKHKRLNKHNSNRQQRPHWNQQPHNSNSASSTTNCNTDSNTHTNPNTYTNSDTKPKQQRNNCPSEN